MLKMVSHVSTAQCQRVLLLMAVPFISFAFLEHIKFMFTWIPVGFICCHQIILCFNGSNNRYCYKVNFRISLFQ